MRHCMVPFCPNRGNVAGVRYFRLTADRRDRWLSALGRQTTEEVSLESSICSNHFLEEDFKEGKQKLKADAVPTLNLRPVRRQLFSRQFPRDKEMREKWIEAVSRANWLPTARSVLCSIHFTEDCFNRTLNKIQLRPGSVPKIFPASLSNLQKVPSEAKRLKKASSSLKRLSKKGVKPSVILPASSVVKLAGQQRLDSYKEFRDKATQTDSPAFYFAHLVNNDEKLPRFTGINFDLLKTFCKCAARFATANNYSSDENLQLNIILVMCKLKLNISFDSLAMLFNKSQSSCSKIFYSTLNLLALSLKPAIYWPIKEDVLKNAPNCFLRFKEIRLVLVCIETKLASHCKDYLYQSAKFLIGITTSGLISYIGPECDGRIIFIKADVIKKLDPDDAIMVDRRIPIDQECEVGFIKIIKPPFFSGAESNVSADLARARVYAERTVQRMKMFKILNEHIDWRQFPRIDDIVSVIAATVNLTNPAFSNQKKACLNS